MIWDKAEDRYRLIFDIIPNPAAILDLDNKVEALNDSCLEYFQNQLPPSVIYGERLPVGKIFPWLVNELGYFLSDRSSEITLEKEVDTFKGKVIFQVRLKKIFDPFENHRNTLILLNDITNIIEGEKKVARARDFYLTLFEEFPAMIWRAGTDGQFNYFNQAWLVFTGISAEEQRGSGWSMLMAEDDRRRFSAVYDTAVKEQRAFEIEFRLRRHDGEYRWVLCVGRPFSGLDGEFAGFIGSCYDITERKTLEEQLSYLAMHDPLTRLPNRRMLDVVLPRMIEETEHGRSSSLFFIDLDNFKQVNDNFGHNLGDEILVELGRILKSQLREGDLLVRLGGDEFAILLDGVQRKEAENVARRLLETVSHYQFITGQKAFNLFLSIGVVMISKKEDQEIFVFRADTAMYQAKEQGGNQFVLYE
jgi:diguanylate cyclase (GGDEF)-like protein/PAS domain S-box-containing protein